MAVQITPETIARTRDHFIEIHRQCIAEAISGESKPNDLASYVGWHQRTIQELEAGECDHTFTFLQRAYWLQTGECVALLS